MAEYVYLQGSEEVGRAANRISEAAERMNQAANSIYESVDRQQRMLDDFLNRFENILQNTNAVVADDMLKSIEEINNTIYAAGAPLGTNGYFKIREICCNWLNKFRKDK